MYKTCQRNEALHLYDQCQSVTKVIQQLGYPSRMQLYNWIRNQGVTKEKKPRQKFSNTPDHPRHPPLELKLQTLYRCFELGENVQLVSEEIGYSRASIYTWRKMYILKGAVGLMNTDDNPRGKLPQGEAVSSKTVEQLKAQMQDMQLEIDVLKETLDVLKKDPGIMPPSVKTAS